MFKHNSKSHSEKDIYLQKLLEKYPYQPLTPKAPAMVSEPLGASNKATLDEAELQAKAFNTVKALTELKLNKTDDIESKLKPINYITQSLTEKNPIFFTEMLRCCQKATPIRIQPIALFFKLKCLSDGSLPNIHHTIHEQLNLKLLVHYLPNHLDQLEHLIQSNKIFQLIVSSQISSTLANEQADSLDLKDLIELMSKLPLRHLCRLYEFIKEKTPEDFPWPPLYKEHLDNIGQFIQNIQEQKNWYDTGLYRIDILSCKKNTFNW